MDELYIPINVNNVHWGFMWVVITNKTIQLFDSQGVNAENNKYLKATENYMYGALTRDQREERQEFAAQKEDWSPTDQSEISPRQGNGYNCGIFTLISMSLLRNGHRLRSNSYFQNTLYLRHSREKLAWTIWKTGLGSNTVHWQPGTQGQTTATTMKRGATRERPEGSYQKKKRRKEGRLILGGAKMQSLIKLYGNKQVNKANGRGQKRNVRSVSEEEDGKGVAARIEQPPRKREKNGNPAFKLG